MLFEAVKANDIDQVMSLLEQGSDINKRNDAGITPLHIAVTNGYKDMVEVLLEKGADVNAKESKLGMSVLHMAAHQGYKDLVATLIDHGATVPVKDIAGATPAQYAMRQGHREAFWMLESHEITANVIPSQKQKKGGKICPKCNLINPGSAQRCDCGYDFEITAYWEVKSADGSVKTYTEESEIIAAIFCEAIRSEQECRHFDVPDQHGKRKETNWKRVSDSLAKSSFSVRVLFEPVWAHTVRGAGLGAALGIICCHAFGIYVFVNMSIFPAGIVFAYSLVCWVYIEIAPNWRIKKEASLGKLFIATIVGLWICASKWGIGWTLQGVFLGLKGLLSAMWVGALAGVFPGMILGTIVGLVRRGRLRRAPTAQHEKWTTLWFKCLVVPAIFVVLVAWAYITYLPKLAHWVSTWR